MFMRGQVRALPVPGRTGRDVVMNRAAPLCPSGNHVVRLEMPASTLARLLAGGHVGAADLRCLDCASRRCLRTLCLRSCIGSWSAKCCGARQECPHAREDGGVESRS